LNRSLSGVETLTIERWEGLARRPRSFWREWLEGLTTGFLAARRDRTSVIDLLAAVIRRLVGAPSFRTAARCFTLTEPI
jgi:hypothetical protein